MLRQKGLDPRQNSEKDEYISNFIQIHCEIQVAIRFAADIKWSWRVVDLLTYFIDKYFNYGCIR